MFKQSVCTLAEIPLSVLKFLYEGKKDGRTEFTSEYNKFLIDHSHLNSNKVTSSVGMMVQGSSRSSRMSESSNFQHIKQQSWKWGRFYLQGIWLSSRQIEWDELKGRQKDHTACIFNKASGSKEVTAATTEILRRGIFDFSFHVQEKNSLMIRLTKIFNTTYSLILSIYDSLLIQS